MNTAWRDTEQNCHYFYKMDTGLIIGQVHNIAHTKIWIANILSGSNSSEEKFLGRYITVDFAKSAVEQYWHVQQRTLIDLED